MRSVRFTPKGGHAQRWHRCLQSAKSRHHQNVESVQGVLVDLPVFHDQVEIPTGVSNEIIEVLKWITFHHEKVGQCAFLNYAELAWVRIAKTGQSKQFGVF
jgi:hypothetical protein